MVVTDLCTVKNESNLKDNKEKNMSLFARQSQEIFIKDFLST